MARGQALRTSWAPESSGACSWQLFLACSSFRETIPSLRVWAGKVKRRLRPLLPFRRELKGLMGLMQLSMARLNTQGPVLLHMWEEMRNHESSIDRHSHYDKSFDWLHGWSEI